MNEIKRSIKLESSVSDILIESPLYQEIQLGGAKIESHNFLLRLLEERFGGIDEDLRAQIKTLSTNQAEELGVKLFRVKTLEEFESYLAEFDKSLIN